MPPTPLPSATVVIMRDGASGVETLMVQRNVELSFHGGSWVFPGGRIDPIDRMKARTDDVVEAARQAAIREAEEEAGVRLEANGLSVFARWVTPEGLPKRFMTWFFVCAVPRSDGVVVDGSEVVDHRWISPDAALAAHARKEFDLPAPTYVTLLEMSRHGTAAAAAAALSAGGIAVYEPKMRQVEEGVCTVYAEDVAYSGEPLDTPGARHRLYMTSNGFKYERG